MTNYIEAIVRIRTLNGQLSSLNELAGFVSALERERADFEAENARLRRRIAELEARPPAPPVEPPTPDPEPEPEPPVIVPDPPVPDPEPPFPDPEPPVVVNPPAGDAIRPDVSGLVSGRLVDVSGFPLYTKPTEADCDWVIENGTARSTRGLSNIPASNGNVAGLAYRASIAAQHNEQGPVTIGVKGNGGVGVVGGQWGASSPHGINNANGSGDVRVRLVGLDPTASMSIGWTYSFGYAEHLEVHDLIIQGQDDSFIMRCTDDAGTVIFDGCTLRSRSGITHASGRHLGNFETLVVRNEHYSGAKFREHWGYFKSARGGGIWLLDNDMLGGNRTCFQIRPGVDENHLYDAPSGQVVIMGNRANGYGFTHGNDPSTAGGGGAISIWSSPDDPIFVLNNTIHDARYGCLMASGQPFSPFANRQGVDRNWYGTTGYPMHSIHIEGNSFGNQRGDRDTVSLSSVGEVHWYDNTVLPGSRGIVLDAQWAMEKACPTRPGSKRNGLVKIHGARPTAPMFRADNTSGQWRQRAITEAELEEMEQE